MRTAVEARRRWQVLTDQFHFPSLARVNQALKSQDNKSNPCDDGLRSVCWRAFLLHEDVGQWSSWLAQVDASRDAYTSLRSHFLKYIERPDDLPSTADPLAEDEESPWQSLRRDESMRTEIYQDVERCLQENHFFREPTTKSRLLDILFIYARLNPDLGYRQGMHELLAPVLWVVALDAIDKASVSDTGNTGDDEVIFRVLDSDYIEHDAFSIFCAIMQTAKQFYEHNDGKSSGHPQDPSSIVLRSQRIHQVVLRRVDADLADHLQKIDILPQIFLTRWFRLLFGREFPFQDMLSMWDLLFAENLRLDLIDLVCVAMLLRIRPRLLESDYSSALSLLLRYPSPDPLKPAGFVLDGLFLEQNLSSKGAATLVSKYSGGLPRHFRGQSTDSPQTKPTRPTPAKKNDATQETRRSASRYEPADRSPVRPGQRRLDSLLQDVSGGIYRRTEGWGVAKAVRGAVGDARRNIQNIQSSASSPALAHADDSGPISPSPPRLSLAAYEELNSRVTALENRNKSLAKLLDNSLAKLNANNSSQSGNEDFDSAVETIIYVQTRLEDSEKPILEKPQTNENEEPTKPAEGVTMATEKVANATAEFENTTSDKTAAEKKDSPSLNLENPQPVRPPPRAPLADSSFSWMLGESKPHSSFMACASAPPERKRRSESRGRPNELFGDKRGKEVGKSHDAAEKDSVVLNQLRGLSDD